jgi:hypothetical protein
MILGFGLVAIAAFGCGGASETPPDTEHERSAMSTPQPVNFTTQDGLAAYALKLAYMNKVPSLVPSVVKAVVPFTYQGVVVLQVQASSGYEQDSRLSPERDTGFDYNGGAAHYAVEVVTAGSKAFVSISSDFVPPG